MTLVQLDRAVEIERLAALDTVDYEVARKEAADRLGIVATRKRVGVGSYDGCKMTLKIRPIRLAAQAQGPAIMPRPERVGLAQDARLIGSNLGRVIIWHWQSLALP
jgi:hypothetical protein